MRLEGGEFEISPTDPLGVLGPGMSAVTSPTAHDTTTPSTSATTARTAGAPTRSANQPWAASRQAGSASTAVSVPIASNISALQLDQGGGVAAPRLADDRLAHGCGPSSRRRRSSARPSEESGRSHHDSTHQVAPAASQGPIGGRTDPKPPWLSPSTTTS